MSVLTLQVVFKNIKETNLVCRKITKELCHQSISYAIHQSLVSFWGKSGIFCADKSCMLIEFWICFILTQHISLSYISWL